ncbi:MAG: hypothetical protein H7833_06205 [Magnetococcus sp. DMHC-1]
MQPRFPSHLHGQQGNILITVMVFLVVTMGISSALMTHFLVTEAGQVEESLAHVRAYWAMSGHVDYLLSRGANHAQGLGAATAPTLGDFQATLLRGFDSAAEVPSVNCAIESVPEKILLCIMSELFTDANNRIRVWNYGNNMAFPIQSTALTDGVEGRYQFALVAAGLGAAPVLVGLPARVKSLNISTNPDGKTVKKYYRRR